MGRAAGVGGLLNHAPGHGLVDQARERRDHQVGHGRAVAEGVLQVGDLAAPDFGDRPLAEGGHDIALDGEPVLGGGGGLAAHRDMLAQVTLGEGGKGGACGFLGRALRVLAGPDAGDDEGGTAAGFCGADDAVAAHGDALRARRAPGLHDIDLGARGIDAHAEAGEGAVPDHRVPARREGVHDALCN